MTSAIFPTYFLARMIVSRPWALFAAVGAVATPGARVRAVPRRGAAAYPMGGACLFLVAQGARDAHALAWSIGAGGGVPDRDRSFAASSPC